MNITILSLLSIIPLLFYLVDGYFEKNKSERLSSQLSIDHDFGEHSHFNIKQSVSYFNRQLSSPGYVFQGRQLNSFTEASYSRRGEMAEWVAGMNVWNENFEERPYSNFPVRNFQQNTVGAFVQNTFKANEWLHIESGVRGDYVTNYGFAFLPRVAVLLKPSASFTSRIGGGMGYKAPTIFTEVLRFNSFNSSRVTQGCSTYSISPTAVKNSSA